MAITSPITLTVGGVAKVLPRINQDNFGGVYFLKETSAEYRLTIRHSYEGKPGVNQMERHNVEFTYTTFDVAGKPTTRTTYLVMRNPRAVDPIDSVNISKALYVWANTVATDLGAWAN